MTDKLENLILEHLRVLRSEIQTMRTEMHTEFKDVKLRMSSIENVMVSIKHDSVCHFPPLKHLASKNIRQHSGHDLPKDRHLVQVREDNP
jgi:hypothetical protein